MEPRLASDLLLEEADDSLASPTQVLGVHLHSTIPGFLNMSLSCAFKHFVENFRICAHQGRCFSPLFLFILSLLDFSIKVKFGIVE